MSMPGTIGSAKLIFNNMNFLEAKIGIVGLGFVGNAISQAYDHMTVTKVIIDPAKGYNNSYTDLVSTDAVFLCVPTPQGDDGSCDTSILESVLSELQKINYTGVIISKCTAPPSVYKTLEKQFPNLIHAPEFLTAANAVYDYANGKFAYIGGEINAYRKEAERIIKLGQPGLTNIIHCSIEEAALAKYILNSFMATKVVFMNEMYRLAESIGCDYENIRRMLSVDPRIGNTHMKVPGPDGLFGFGGYCFPKDTAALLKFAEQAGVEMMVLDAAVRKNTFLRLTESK